MANGCKIIYKESHTGTKVDRPEFNKMLEVLKKHDTLMVTKLDRFARTASEGITLIRNLVEKGIKVHILNMGIADNTPMGKLMITIMSGFAEFERDMIIERTQAGKEIAKQDPSFREGRPKVYTDSQIEWAIGLLKENSYNKVAKMTGISKSTIIRAVRKKRMEEKQYDDR